jgi:hypothetical protein
MRTQKTTTGAEISAARNTYKLQAECCARLESMEIPIPHYSRMSMMMTLEFAHDDCPLDFAALVAADKSNFLHDMLGLWRHVSRETLKIEGFFRPRFALRTAVAA